MAATNQGDQPPANQPRQEPPINDRSKIRELIQTARDNREIVEVRIKAMSGRFFTFFAHPPKDQPTSGLYIAPLEPAVGNGKMRLTRDISISFFNKSVNYTAETKYVQTFLGPTLNVVQLDFPDLLGVVTLRKTERVILPEDLGMEAEIYTRGLRLFSGGVVDFSEGGALFENNSPKKDIIKVGDIVDLEIYPPPSSRLERFDISAEIARLLELRRPDGTGTKDLIGVRFLRIAPGARKVAAYLQKMYGTKEEKKGWWPL